MKRRPSRRILQIAITCLLLISILGGCVADTETTSAPTATPELSASPMPTTTAPAISPTTAPVMQTAIPTAAPVIVPTAAPTTSPQPTQAIIYGSLEVHFLDVGQADSIFIELPNNETMLIDAGNGPDDDYVIGYIRNCGYNAITYLVATHPHEDHIGGMSSVVSDFTIGSIYMPKASTNTKTFENLLLSIQGKGLTIKTAKAGVSIINSDNLIIEIVAPNGTSYEDLNNHSAVIKITYGDTSFLFTGDAETVSENEITADVNVDVLKVGHHGSSSSTGQAFLDKVSPAYAVISVGADNSYGHPDSKVIQRLEGAGATIYRTDLDGTVTFISDGTYITVDKAPAPAPTPKPTPIITIAPTAAIIAPSNDSSDDDILVYITKTGEKYHRGSCSYLSKSKNEITLSDAKADGYTPCSRCNPPE